MNRRNFLKRIVGVAAGLAVAPAIPISKSKPKHVELVESKYKEFYAWEEQGFAIIDNRRIFLAEF